MADPFDALRNRMVLDQLLKRGIRGGPLMEAFRRVPRHLFAPSDRRQEAYQDHPVPIGEGQTLSQPYMVALMLESLDLLPGMKVLEIGTGSGYQAAILADLKARVYSVERIPLLAETAAHRLQQMGIVSVNIRVGDGSFGWPEESPFDAIVVSAAVPQVPARLVGQLKEAGRMVVPVGDRLSQTLTRVERRQGRSEIRVLCGCLFVPLIGEEGWRDP